MTEWISVNDRLPKHGQQVLAFTVKGQAVCIFVDTEEMNKLLIKNNYPEDQLKNSTHKYSFCSQEIVGNTLNGVTHWTELLEPPK